MHIDWILEWQNPAPFENHASQMVLKLIYFCDRTYRLINGWKSTRHWFFAAGQPLLLACNCRIFPIRSVTSSADQQGHEKARFAAYCCCCHNIGFASAALVTPASPRSLSFNIWWWLVASRGLKIKSMLTVMTEISRRDTKYTTYRIMLH